MAFRGERFVLDLGSDDEPDTLGENASSDPPSLAVPGMIGEILERSPTGVPAPPKPPSTGFPAPRRRTRPSAFKQRREAPSAAPAQAPKPAPTSEKDAIGEENRRQLDAMSPAQIQQEREELMATMDTSLLERFLRRARIDSDETTADTPKASASTSQSATPEDEKKGEAEQTPPTAQPQPNTTQQQESPLPPAPSTTSITPKTSTPHRDDLPPTDLPADLHPASEYPLPAGLHFPAPSTPMPNLDPNSPSFLTDLQTHYFPNVSHDSSALTWLQPPPTDAEDPDSTSAYHPSSAAEAVHPSDLRFTLLGTVLSPSTSLSLPTTLGLHHHGKDPHAAGYTIPELAILSQSSFPAQRCIAWQVLGRILFRLGKGQFGERGSPLAEGLWSVIEHEKVVAGMLAEADGDSNSSSNSKKKSSAGAPAAEKKDQSVAGTQGAIGRHASASAWAVEGVWLWQMGGGGDRGLLKEGTIRSQ